MDYPYNRSSFPLSPHEAPNYGVTQSPDGTPDSASWLPPQVPYTTPVPVSYAFGPYRSDPSTYDAVQGETTPADYIGAYTSGYKDQCSRKTSITQDKESESSMALRRRAQNRASQRAFRERRNQRVADLEDQLKGLCMMHEDLRYSYEREADKVASMKRRIEGLKAEIELLASSNDDTSNDAVFGRPRMPERFDAVPDPEMPVFYPFSGFDLDRQLLDPHPETSLCLS